ncbi:hypothetical protein V1478_017430 [Vespula squamosa]|uniref:Uncharacterized protein n=1 Tax=Vespula squamosa TaxID=30214 RepID=A0ABD1ZWU9_VESSQ
MQTNKKVASGHKLGARASDGHNDSSTLLAWISTLGRGCSRSTPRVICKAYSVVELTKLKTEDAFAANTILVDGTANDVSRRTWSITFIVNRCNPSKYFRNNLISLVSSIERFGVLSLEIASTEKWSSLVSFQQPFAIFDLEF